MNGARRPGTAPANWRSHGALLPVRFGRETFRRYVGDPDLHWPQALTLTPKRARAEDCAQAESTLRAPTRRDRPGFLAS
jgi:hypothetical protein